MEEQNRKWNLEILKNEEQPWNTRLAETAIYIYLQEYEIVVR